MLQLISRPGRSAPAGFLVTFLVVLLVIALPCALQAQTAGEGAVTGTVTDSTGAVVPKATVTATNAATHISTETHDGFGRPLHHFPIARWNLLRDGNGQGLQNHDAGESPRRCPG